MTNLVRDHSHWRAFLAEIDDGRIVGVELGRWTGPLPAARAFEPPQVAGTQ